MRLAAVIVLLAAAATIPARADRIHLKQGGYVDGVIERETEQDITLNLGGGRMTVPRASVVRIERTAAESNEQLKMQWRREHFLDARNVPAGYEDLAADFLRVRGSRAGAADGARTVTAIDAEEESLSQETTRIRAEYVALGKENRTPPVATNVVAVEAYNARVGRQNEIQTRIAEIQARLESDQARRREADKVTADYIAALRGLRAEFTRRRPEKPEPLAAPFFEGLAAGLAELESESVAYSIPVLESTRRGRVVEVELNGRARGRFVVDTGAGIVTVTPAMAARAGISVDPARTTRLILANGQRVECPVVRIGSVQVGDARAVEVAGAVVDIQGTDFQADGLLGMSFLRNFLVEFDGRTGNLTLRRFEPH